MAAFARRGSSLVRAQVWVWGMFGSVCFIPAASAQALGDTFALDVDHTLACRRLLWEDPLLGPLNLGVRVKDRVATLWGPAPSLEIRRRAEECLRTLIELADVRNELHIDPSFDWGPPPVPAPPGRLPNELPPLLPAPLGPRPGALDLPRPLGEFARASPDYPFSGPKLLKS